MKTPNPIESVQLDRDFRVVFDFIKNIPVDPNDLDAQKRYWPLNVHPHLAPGYVVTDEEERHIAWREAHGYK
jgi:hypothetical protein